MNFLYSQLNLKEIYLYPQLKLKRQTQIYKTNYTIQQTKQIYNTKIATIFITTIQTKGYTTNEKWECIVALPYG